MVGARIGAANEFLGAFRVAGRNNRVLASGEPAAEAQTGNYLLLEAVVQVQDGLCPKRG